jgi:hypothetical protein
MTSSPFNELLKYTKPGPKRRCVTCQTYSLRLYTEPGTLDEKVVCTNPACRASPFHREE